MKRLFTERRGQSNPRVKEELDEITRRALWALLSGRINDEWFGLSFPEKCADGYVYAGTDLERLQHTMEGYGLLWPPDEARGNRLSPDGQVFDAIEFSYEYVAEAKDPAYHSYMCHTHYSYDQASGRAKFEDDVNRILERNGIAFELKGGEVTRIAQTAPQATLAESVFDTGDGDLDRMLEYARTRFFSRSLDVRRESLEKLWDAWERLKTIEPGKNKKEQTAALLARASKDPNLLERLNTEALELTEIGNMFMIRHTEKDKIPITESGHIDYLFERMYSIIHLLLKASGRGG